MINIKNLKYTRKFVMFAKDIIKGFEYTNAKGENKESVILKMPIGSDTLVTMSYPAKMITPLKLNLEGNTEEGKENTLFEFQPDDTEGYTFIRIKFQEKNENEFILRTLRDGEFVDEYKLSQKEFFDLLKNYEKDVVIAWAKDKLNG
jgi:hypothetical protein